MGTSFEFVLKSLFAVLFVLLSQSAVIIHTVAGQQQQGGQQRPEVGRAQKVTVIPECGNQLISAQVLLNPDFFPSGGFTDWIVVGTTNRPECRLQGNGELQYVIEIAVFNDPCGTQMSAPGVIENRIRIGQNSLVILEGDENLTVRCVYGLPEVSHVTMPTIHSNFDLHETIEHETAVSPRIQSSPEHQQQQNTTVRRASSSSYMYALIGILVMLAIALLVLLLLYFCLRRRRIRAENRKRVLVAVPPTSELGKLGHLWFSSKAAPSHHRDPRLLNQNYDPNRDPNSMTTSATTTTHEHDESLNGSVHSLDAESLAGGAFDTMNNNAGDSDRRKTTADIVAAYELNDLITAPRSYSEWRQCILDAAKQSRRVENDAGGEDVLRATTAAHATTASPGAELSAARSITEIYRSAEMRDPETGSTYSTDGGESYIGGAGTNGDANRILTQEWVENVVQCVNKHRGFGPRKLTEQEIGRWRQLVRNSPDLQRALHRSQSRSEVESLFLSRPECRQMFSREKWLRVIDAVADFVLNPRHCASPDDMRRQTAAERRLAKEEAQNRAAQAPLATVAAAGSSLNVYIGDVVSAKPQRRS